MTQVSRIRKDGFVNLLTGLGDVSRDVVGAHQFQREPILTAQQCEALYHFNDFAATIVDAVVEDALREPVSVLCKGDPEASTKATNELRRLGTQESVSESDVWGRCVGDCAILLGANDGQPAYKPLNRAAIKTLDYIDVVPQQDLSPLKRYGDDRNSLGVQERTRPIEATSDQQRRALELDGEVEVYRMMRGDGGRRTLYVHETRLVFLHGARTSQEERRMNNGWHHSVLQRVHRVLQQCGLTWDTIGQIIANARQWVLKMKHLFDAIEDGDKDTVMDRLSLVYLAMGLGIMPIDVEESFECQSFTFAGLPEMTDRNWQRLAAAARMPLTRLMGVSPAGLNATGESDDNNWKAEVKAHQTRIRPAFEAVLEVAFLAKQGPFAGKAPDSWEIVFPSLWQMTAGEEAAYRKTVAETDAVNVERGLYSGEEAAKSHYRPEGYTHEVQIDFAEREKKAQAASAPTTMLNGAQVTAMQEVIRAATAGEIPPDAARGILVIGFGLTAEQAASMLGGIEQMQSEKKEAAALAAQRQVDEAAARGVEDDASAAALLEARQRRQAEKAAA